MYHPLSPYYCQVLKITKKLLERRSYSKVKLENIENFNLMTEFFYKFIDYVLYKVAKLF